MGNGLSKDGTEMRSCDHPPVSDGGDGSGASEPGSFASLRPASVQAAAAPPGGFVRRSDAKRRPLAFVIATAVWGISWILVPDLALYALMEPGTGVAFAVLTVVLAVGGPLVGVWVGRRIWHSVPDTPVEDLPPRWGQKPHED